MRKLAILLTLVGTLVVLAAAQETGALPEANAPQKYEITGVCSFTYPAGWQKFARPNAAGQPEWLVIPGNTNTYFTPAVTHSEFPLAQFVENNVKNNATERRVMLSKGEFKTDAGDKGFKVRWKRITESGRELLIDQYFFAGKKDTDLLFTGIALFTDAEKYEPVFDANMKSLVIQK